MSDRGSAVRGDSVRAGPFSCLQSIAGRVCTNRVTLDGICCAVSHGFGQLGELSVS